jgi:hypothetical protein
MSYTDSKGNRIPGTRDLKAAENIPPEMGGEEDLISMGEGSARPDTEEASKLFDKVNELQSENILLKKKLYKYKKQCSMMPELRTEL